MSEMIPIEQQVTGMTMDRLREVFDLVKPEGNWKMPIDRKVPLSAAQQREIKEAVIWFAGGEPTIRLSGEHWHVTGAGYYTWVGA